MITALNHGAAFYGIEDRPLRVLVVDDDPIMREWACLQLSAPDVIVEGAVDGLDGLDHLSRIAYDIVLCDLHMPKLDGLGMLLRVRENSALKTLPVVMVTSRSDIFAIDRAFELGATSFTTKPVNWPLLCYELRYLLRASAMEEELRKSEKRSAQLLEAQSNVLRLFQHETRTPMNAIVGFAGLLTDQLDGPLGHHNYQDYAKLILESAKDLDRTLNDLQLLARLEGPTTELMLDEYFMSSLLAIALDGMPQPLHGAARTICVDETIAQARRITCDANLFTRALCALFTNALTHGAAAQACSVGYNVTPDGDAVLTIRDYGPGIPGDRIPDLLTPFSQGGLPLDRASNGLGIGLALAHKIITLHGGRLSLAPAPDCGLSVGITLPVTAVQSLPGIKAA